MSFVLAHRMYQEPPSDDAVEWALTGPWPACPRCGAELVHHLVRSPTLAYVWIIQHMGHRAPCGQRCLPGLDSWVGDCGPPHVSRETCKYCKQKGLL